MTDFSKLKKAPTGASFAYGPITVTKEQLAQRGRLIDLRRAEADAAIAKVADRMARLATIVFAFAPSAAFADVDRAAPVQSLRVPAFHVGDYVRGDNEHDPAWHANEPRWFEGVVESIYDVKRVADRAGCSIRVSRAGKQYAPGDRIGYVNTAHIRHVDRPPLDPLDVKHDGVTLRLLLQQDEMRQRTERPLRTFEPLTPAQRAAVSAHWSAELRARVAASAERERNMVRIDLQDEP